MTDPDRIRLAEEHAEWLAEMIRQIVYIVARDNFLHGMKHEREGQGRPRPAEAGEK